MCFSAAHCFEKKRLTKDFLNENVKVTLGEWKTDKIIDCSSSSSDEICDEASEVKFQSVKIHENYAHNRSNADDIAIGKLSWEIGKTSLIDSIELPDQSLCNLDSIGEEWIFTGFGELSSFYI